MKSRVLHYHKNQGRVEVLVEVGREEVEEFQKKTLKDLSHELEVKGFRKGKVPEEIARDELGEEKILAEAIEQAVRTSYLKAITEHGLEVIAQPEIELLSSPLLKHKKAESPSAQALKGEEEEAQLEFKAKVQVLPLLTLPDYKKIASGVKRRVVRVEEKEIKEALGWLQQSRAKRSQVLRPAQKGDFVEIEFSSPQATKQGLQKDGFILGRGRLIPGFEEELKGMAPNQEKTFSLTFPRPHFQRELAGKRVDFRVKMKQIQKVELPELNDQFAKGVGRFETLTELRKSIEAGLQREKEMAESQRVRQEALEKIIQAMNLKAPSGLVEREEERMMQELRQKVEQQFRLPLADYLKQMRKSEQELRNSFKAVAQKRVREFLVLKELSREEAIEVTDQEVSKGVSRFLSQYPNKRKVEKELDPDSLKEYIRESIKNEKTLERLESFTGR